MEKPVENKIGKITGVDQKGMDFIIKEEGGCKLKPYLDSVGIPTIGIGCIYYENGRRVMMSDVPITKERGMLLFRNRLREFERNVTKRVKTPINQNQFNALVDISFNIGIGAFNGSTLLKLVNIDPFHLDIGKAFLMWRYAGGGPVLLGRRKRDINLYYL